MHRVAVVTSYFPTKEQPYRGHSAYQTLRQMQKWAEIEVFVPFATYPRWMTPKYFPYFQPDCTYSPADIQTSYLQYPAIPWLSRGVNGKTCYNRLLPYLRQSKPDVILNYWLYPDGYAATLAGETLKVPVVLGAIGSDLCRISDRATHRMTRKAISHASSVIAVSEDLRQRAIQFGASPDRAHKVLNGCDSSIFHLADRADAKASLGLDQASRLILYIGRLDEKKGLGELISAMPALVAKWPDLKVAFVGEGLFLAEILRRSASAGISKRVILPGACDSTEVARWMAASDVFCLPSYSEGCPNVLVEALACGRPVVATAVGGIPELVTPDCGILIPSRNSEQLARALKEALSRSWDEDAIAERFRRSWDEVARETYEICSDAFALRTQPGN